MSIARKLIGFSYRKGLKPILFKFEPERVHNWFTKIGYRLGSWPITNSIMRGILRYENKLLEQTVAGIKFDNPVGLSAGFDKDGYILPVLKSVGFGFTVVGSITADAYEGNVGPRLYRLFKSRGLVVNFGLKNEGVKVITQRILELKESDFPIGISIAKTNCHRTSNATDGIEDYAKSLTHLARMNVGSFYTINISCPNTFGGEPFTTPDLLEKLLARLDGINHKGPLFLKMAISMEWSKVRDLLLVATEHRVDGVVIGNLNKNYRDPAVKDEIPNDIKGGISGLPTQKISNELITRTYQEFQNRFIIVGVGGIFSASDAYEKICRGATLVQLITGMIYEGPQLIGEINEGLTRLLRRDGYASIQEAIGSYHGK